MMVEEKLACNICGTSLDATLVGAHLKDHSHVSKKKDLEARLAKTTSETDSNNSVATMWQASISTD